MKLTDKQGTVRLSNGVEMPYLGLGVFKSRDGQEVIDAVTYALEAGYRHIDTAAVYNNEAGVGQAIRQYQLPRNEVFVTRDRKSTRLNSSHVRISYAVFCLKKKKKT